MSVTNSDSFPLIGILGGGQLGRMMALAAIRMGLRVRFLSPKPAGPMEGLGETVVGDWHDVGVLRSFAEGCTVVTVESEWAPAEYVANAVPEVAVWPSPETLSLIRDKGVQKARMVNAGLPVPRFVQTRTLEAAQVAAERLGYPVLLKRLKGSYDGYGNATVHSADELAAAWPKLSDDHHGLLVEAFVDFKRELSVLVARTPAGDRVVYPVAYTEQRDHRCHAVVVPAEVSDETASEAVRIATAAVEAVGGVGLTAVELFETQGGEILVNELAPRPHNTGHYSIEGSHTSQFENHLRGILGWPLGDPSLRAPCAVMVNVLGHRSGAPSTDGYADALAVPGAGIHLYGKFEVRPRRKMGHVTVTGVDVAEVRARAEQAAEHIRL